MGILCGSGILIHAQHPRIREQLCQLFLGFLGAEAPVLQLAAAGGADGGRFHLAAAVVAQYLVRRFVVHHRHAALCALEHLAAVLALGHGLVAPAVQQQNGLLACIQIAADGIFQRKTGLPRVACRQLCAHIHDLHRGQRVAAVALGQPHQLGAAMLGRVKALGAGGGACQQQQCTAFRRALPGHLVGRIAGRGFRAVGVLLLLIDDDEPDVFQRRKDGTAGTHHDVCAAVLNHLPLQKTFGVVEGRVLHRHPAAKLTLEPQDHLRGQADLRHQHQRTPALLQTAGNEL